jgi:hypothetical protein
MDYSRLHDAIAGGRAAGEVPRWALSVLREIGSGRRRLRAVRHPLGFLCLPTEREGSYGVCVHLWAPGLAPNLTTSPAHAHSWDLTSYVLYGTLANQHLHVADATTAATHRVFEVRSRGDEDELYPTPRLVTCRPGAAGVHGRGEVYTLPAGEFHATELPAGPDAATVALAHARQPGADLSLGPPGTRRHVVHRSRCGTGETAEAARMIAARLEEAGAA